MKPGYTIDEKFLLKIFELAEKRGDPKTPIEVHQVGRLLGLNDRSMATIVRTLAQTNFIKKQGEERVSLTENGLSLIESLQESF